MGKKDIVVVTADGCPFCKDVKSFLDRNEVKYKEISPAEYEKDFEDNILAVPVVCDKKSKECVRGYRPERIKNY